MDVSAKWKEETWLMTGQIVPPLSPTRIEEDPDKHSATPNISVYVATHLTSSQLIVKLADKIGKVMLCTTYF